MTDREKVIKGLEKAIQNFEVYSGDEYGREYAYARVGVDVLADALALLKAQEPPTDVAISSAIECLLHPQDADDSDMAKAIDTAVRAMRLLKAQEPVEPLRINHDTKWQRDTECLCGECGGSFYRMKVNFCPWCGKAAKWE